MRMLGLSLVVIGLAGCQSAGVVPPVASLEPAVAPVAQDTAETTLADASGVTQPGVQAPLAIAEPPREKRVSSVFGPQFTGTGHGLKAGQIGAGAEEKLLGTWKVYLKEDQRQCELMLSPRETKAGYGAKASNCMNGDLFFVSTWGINGEELVLLDDFSRVKGSMRKTAEGNWEGQLSSETPIVLVR